MTKDTHVFPAVYLGENSSIGLFIILGEPPRGVAPGELETHIGTGAIIRSHTVIYAGNKIGINFQTGHGVMIRESNNIGDNVSIGTHSVIEHHVEIKNRVRIHTNVFVPEFSILEDDAWIGPNVVLTNARYPHSASAKNNLQGPIVKRNAKIGANSTILPGITIGVSAFVGAGSVVTKDVPDGAVVAGNPAVIVKYIYDIPEYLENTHDQ
ncbi:MAG: acyltransferase [Anaerolineales bacterium]|jgi:acetyltransferase-like isoleucine patch superfamily enzyme|nr:acyltransferase [Anaerolineales bacterium]